MTLFRKFVEIGRVVRVHRGPNAGKLAVIVDVLDQSRALINGPNMKRHIIGFKHLVLTPIVAKVPRGARRKALTKVLVKEGVQAKFDALDGNKRLARAHKRQSMTDFDRFKVMIARKQRAVKVRQQVNKLKKASAKK